MYTLHTHFSIPTEKIHIHRYTIQYTISNYTGEFSSILTSTLTPGRGNIWAGGLSLGRYRKNSFPSLYHLTEYRDSPWRSNLHCRVEEFPLTVCCSIRTSVSLRLRIPATELLDRFDYISASWCLGYCMLDLTSDILLLVLDTCYDKSCNAIF